MENSVEKTIVSTILRSDAGILLVERALAYKEFLNINPDSDIGIRLWELPGGKPDPGEDPQRAGIREMEEETGISVAPSELKLVGRCTYDLEGLGRDGSRLTSHRTHIIYEAVRKGQPEIKISDEHLGFRWVKEPSALNELRMIPEIRSVVANEFQPSLANPGCP